LNSVIGFKSFVENYSPAGRELIHNFEGVTVLNEDGTLCEAAKKIVQLCKDKNVCIFTGHLAPQESLALCKEANRIGYKKMVWCHPMTTGATDEQLAEAVSYGAYLEFNFILMLPASHLHNPRRVAEIISKVGADHLILTSDHYGLDNPDQSEMLRMWIANLLPLGVSEEDLRTMMVKNPQMLVDYAE
jgi:predicted metal-dependent phosphotriesterase family hydrolase